MVLRPEFSGDEIRMIISTICFVVHLEKEKCGGVQGYLIYKYVSKCLCVILTSVKKLDADFSASQNKSSDSDSSSTHKKLLCMSPRN